MGGGLGEESVTRYFYENLAKRFNNIKFIKNEAVSDFFTDIDMWEDYFAYLEKYHQASVVDTNFNELRNLYKKLGANYVININSDPGFIPRYPSHFSVYIQAQIWDLGSGKLVWEGFVQGQDVVSSAEDTERVKAKMVNWVSKRMANEMGRGRSPLVNKQSVSAGGR
jgi:hypothetical protein